MTEEHFNKLQLIERTLALPVYLITLGAMLWFLRETQTYHRDMSLAQQAYSRQLASEGHAAVDSLASNIKELAANLGLMQRNIEKQTDILTQQVAILNSTLPHPLK